MIGSTVAHYDILEQLGQGGMGVVYKARDTKLDRFVALKFLTAHLHADPTAKARFVQEAKAASALDHPNLCTIHEIGETDDGQLFIAMPFYAGDTLKYRLEGHPLPIEQVVDIASQIARGLERAHDAGIVHRDIKPANIMVTNRNEVKILDFGIAKLEHGVNLTQTGSTVGTIAYMSPEQSTGGETDRRSDLWAVGVLFYEMLTGSRPFVGAYDQAVVYAIINEDPKPVQEVNRNITDALAKIVAKLLSKNPSDRFQTAGELLAALSNASGIHAAPSEPARERRSFLLGKSTWYGVAVVLIVAVGFFLLRSPAVETAEFAEAVQEEEPQEHATLAVLPFSNLRRDPETDFLGYALADQVIGSLTYVKNLTVRPASSVRQYQDGDYDVQQAGASLGADYVMAGNYLQQNDRMRLTVELVDVKSREMIWREPIDLEYKDVFGMQDLVADRLLKRLEVQFSEAERSRMNADTPSDPVAYEYYLRALSYPEDREGNQLAIDLLEKAISLDSTFAPAWDQLGVRLRTQGYWDMGGKEVTLRAKACYENALKLNPDLLSALSHVSLFYAEIGQLDEAYAAAERVLDINANNAEGHFARGYVLRYAGLAEMSADEMRKAIAADSTNPTFRSAGFTFRTTRDYDEALVAFGLGSVAGLQQGWMAIFLHEDGRIDTAKSLMLEASGPDPDGVSGLWASSIVAAWNGDYSAGLASARRWESANLLDGEGVYFLASTFCANNDSEHCMSLLRKSVDSGYYNYPIFEIDPFLDVVRGTPAFTSLIEQMKRKSEAFRERHFTQ